ncbi:MAG: hypothetical protein CVU42_06185 [Chloroflexi bacterium HGW-Chloroflexi-4]|jgi:PAS domain S-box-containing protein|nr:MAG: hypothetical protein CVU42_06185 [Chloroflexi bacterium HGW-Chloroflexi-4]
MQIQIFLSIIVGTCALALALAFFAFRQQKSVPGIRVFAFFSLAAGLLALAELISMVSKTTQGALFWFNIRAIFLGFTPTLWLLFVLIYYQRKKWLSNWILIILSIIPLGTILLPMIPLFSQLWVQQNVSFFQVESFWLVDTSTRIPGPWFFIHSIYSLLIVLFTMAIIIFDAIKCKTIKRPLSIMLLSGCLAYLVAGFYPSFFPVGNTIYNPIVMGIGIGELFHVISVFTFNFLMPSNQTSQVNSDTARDQEKQSFNLLVLIFIVIAVSIVSIGFLSNKNFQHQYRSQIEAQLTSISLLKVSDIQKWRNERLDDALTFFNNDSFSQIVEDYTATPSLFQNINLLKSWLNAYSAHTEYDQVFFVDLLHNTVVTSNGAEITLAKHLELVIPEIMRNGAVHFEDFHKDSENSPIYLSIVIPVYSTTGMTPLGVVVMRIDPKVYLYPMILRWPVPSESAETALVRLENKSVLYLTDLRFEPNAPLNKFIDLSDSNRPSVKAVTGSIGIVEGINYRSHHVIADVRPVTGTPWFLVSRIDINEVSGPLRERERLSWVLYTTLILASGVGLNLIWRQLKLHSLITQNKIQGEILERDRKLKEAQEMAHLGFWYWDVKSGDVEWSDQVYKIFQIDPKNFKPKIDSILALSPWPEEQNRDKELIDRAINTHQPGMYEQKFLRPDNSIGYYSSTFLGQFDEKDDLVSIVGSVMDITNQTIKDQALVESEKKFKTLFDHAAVGVAIIDTKTGQYVDINQKYCDFLGYSKEEMLSKTFQSVTESKYLKINIQQNNKLLRGKIKEFSLEKQYIQKDGNIVWGELNASPLWEPGTQPEKYLHIAVVKDITEQKIAELALRDSEKKFREMVANLDEGLFSATMDGILVDHNEAFNRILGLPVQQDLRGFALPDFWENKEERQKYLSDLNLKGSVSSFQISARKINGEAISILLSAHLVRNENNKPIKIDGVFMDITNRIHQEERLLATQEELQRLFEQAEKSRRALLTIVEDQKLAQDEIKQLNKTLEDRVNQRTAELKASNDELESFAYSISHDLRAPLRAIDGYSRILEQDYAKVLDVEGVRLLNIVRSSTRSLDRLITDLLSLSRVGRSELKLEILDVNSMIDSIYLELTTPEMQERIKFKVQELPSGYGDATLIRHVWMNLISNAIKYSSPKDHPVIEIFGKSDEKKCTYSIKDNGVGFNPDFKDKLFGLFQRLHKASDFEGTGVGLAIVHRIVARHNGEVWGNGEIEVGAEFTFTLPKKIGMDE